MKKKGSAMCGVAGVYGVEQPLRMLGQTMKALHYRGGQGTGVALLNDSGGSFYERVADEYSELDRKINFQVLGEMEFTAGIGHLRYGTAGTRRALANTQPFYGQTKFGDIYLGHNGDTPFYSEERDKLSSNGAAFFSDCDSEFFLHYIGQASADDFVAAVKRGIERYPGTYALSILIRDSEGIKLILARDPSGNRPLFWGRLGAGFIAASEDSAFEAVGGEVIREINPGEMLVLYKGGLSSLRLEPIRELINQPQHCIFENIYFSFPNSKIFGLPVAEFREALGRKAAKRYGGLVANDEIIANVPDSSNAFADGFCKELRRPLERVLVRRHMIKTFTKENNEERHEAVREKFSVNPDKARGKRIWLLDDSVVRGITARRLIRVLRAAGALWVGIMASAPPIIGPCHKGIDHAEDDLVARQNLIDGWMVDLEAIRRHIEADALYYNTREDLVSVIRELGGNPDNFCFGCFDNKEPIWNAW